MKEPISAANAPQPIGPYSQAIRAGGFLFVSGQAGVDPASGNLVAGDVRAQTEQTMRNLQAILAAGGSRLEQVVKSTVYLRSLADFAAMNEIYGKFFTVAPPARATVEVSRLPKDALVEIEVIALLSK